MHLSYTNPARFLSWSRLQFSRLHDKRNASTIKMFIFIIKYSQLVKIRKRMKHTSLLHSDSSTSLLFLLWVLDWLVPPEQDVIACPTVSLSEQGLIFRAHFSSAPVDAALLPIPQLDDAQLISTWLLDPTVITEHSGTPPCSVRFRTGNWWRFTVTKKWHRYGDNIVKKKICCDSKR